MINFRTIFNISYSYLMILFMILLIGMILLLNRDLKSSLKTIGTTISIAGVITLIIAIILELSINMFVSYQYKIFIQVISSSLFVNLLYAAGISIIIGIICIFFSRKQFEQSNKKS